MPQDLYRNGYEHGKAVMAYRVRQGIYDLAATSATPQETLYALLTLLDDVPNIDSGHLSLDGAGDGAEPHGGYGH